MPMDEEGSMPAQKIDYTFTNYEEWSHAGAPGNPGATRGRPAAKTHTAVAKTVTKPTQIHVEGSSGQNAPLPGFTTVQWNSLLSVFGNSLSTNDRMAGPSLEEADWNGRTGEWTVLLTRENSSTCIDSQRFEECCGGIVASKDGASRSSHN
ncbi:unnamed protein product [Cuscuta epithymum]|uniref:Uncharacterized protein n=1 Tax=Cuscuta epithymum TaxID=186058 RepID=A0AAV0D215_9ASTE|nr:unnamed protein product [Cuscuta epithymum]